MSIFQHHHYHLILFLLYIHLATTLSTNKTKIPSCDTFDCGDGVTISYPFWVSNPTSNYYCGYQGLEVRCKDKFPTFRAFSDNYTITEVDTDNKTVSMRDRDVVDKSCPRVQHQVNLTNTSIFNYASGVTNLTFFFNCSIPVLPDANLASCLAEEAGRSYVFIEPVQSDTYDTLSEDCKGGVVTSPVLVDNTDRNKLASMFPGALKGGFELTWKAPETGECGDCESTGGYCGYRNKKGNEMEFACFCPNGSVNSKDCNHVREGISLKAIIIIVVAISFLGAIVFAIFAGILLKKKKIEINAYKEDTLSDSESLVGKEFQLMGIEIAQEATNNFAKTNKLGEGGFGPVYKGLLADGTEVAIKRLSHSSSQGSEEFKNEVKLIAKLQHKNLVKLLGCCVEGGEKLLIYEYLPNGSLDMFLDDPDRRAQMDWTKRMKIVLGVTKGLIYLHEDSQLKVVHRDMKPSNVLLDHSMNPKISDFGLARIFDGDDKEANTNRVVGTYGYMAPEFALAGLFSVKSDVFGFGVLLLEIISGQRNGRFYFLKNQQSLLKRAWHLWKEKKGEELVNELADPSIAGTFPTSEAIRCIQIGLLCVQENAMDRPKMSMVLRMFENEQMVLMEPHQPPSFTSEGELAPPMSFSDMPEFTSTNAPPMSFSDMPEFTSTNEITMVDVEVR